MMAARAENSLAPIASRACRERLVVKDEENLGVMGRFMRAMLLNLLKDPAKVKVMEKLDLVVCLRPPSHPESSLTLTFAGGRVMLENGFHPGADMVISCEPALLIRLGRMPAGPAALGFLRSHEGRSLLAAACRRELKIKGLVRHPLGMMRFSKFMSTA